MILDVTNFVSTGIHLLVIQLLDPVGPSVVACGTKSALLRRCVVSKICQCVDVIVSERDSFHPGHFSRPQDFLCCNYVIYTLGSAHGQIPKLEVEGYVQDDSR